MLIKIIVFEYFLTLLYNCECFLNRSMLLIATYAKVLTVCVC